MNGLYIPDPCEESIAIRHTGGDLEVEGLSFRATILGGMRAGTVVRSGNLPRQAPVDRETDLAGASTMGRTRRTGVIAKVGELEVSVLTGLPGDLRSLGVVLVKVTTAGTRARLGRAIATAAAQRIVKLLVGRLRLSVDGGSSA